MHLMQGNAFNLFLIIILNLLVSEINACSKVPQVKHGRRTRGDNGYKLLVSNVENGYKPDQSYNVLLLGSRTHNNVQYFTHFAITAEASNPGARRPISAGPKRVGHFSLFGDALAKFNSRCVNTIVESDDLVKTEVQVMWQAPQKGSGCVAITAMVYSGPNSWYMDDGNLTKIICEEKTNMETVRKECCACDEAKYSFVFEGIWSNETHPKDYPYAIWLTHFSDVIGASHESNFSFWGENHLATDGFRSLAEWGSPSLLEIELRGYGPRLRTLIKAAGLWYPNVNTNTSAKFRVDRKHHKVSLVSMFGPSPDWVVGINGLNLCKEDCSWRRSVDINLYPWDAGTDSGISYMSPNAETFPREKMYRITTMYPEDPRAPFYDPNLVEMPPLAKLYIRREKVLTKSCDDDFLQALQSSDVGLDEEEVHANCKVTPFSQWTPCSVTCGKGLRTRTREYINKLAAERSGCKLQMVSKEMCVAAIPECKDDTHEDDEGENLALSQSTVSRTGEGAGICQTTQWSDWSECSSSCGVGISMRTRTFVNHLGRKRCPHISVVEKEKCMKGDCHLDETDIPDSLCPTSQWSDWSPCSATCGKGISIRTRLLLVEPDYVKTCMDNGKKLNEQKECVMKNDCRIDRETARDICRSTPDEGPCRGNYQRFTFNTSTKKCERFIYGGCRGNRNNFLTETECMRTCMNGNF